MTIRKIAFVIVLALVGQLSFARAAAQMPLTLTPESTLIVIPPGRASVLDTQPAATLQEYLRKIYGVTTGFDIEAEGKMASTDGKIILALGRTHWADAASLTKLSPFGYEIKRAGNVVVISGSDAIGKDPGTDPNGNSFGTSNGVVHFLDEFCGVRFYMPGDLWTSIPVGKKIVLPAIDETSNPFVIATTSTGLETVPGMNVWFAMNRPIRVTGGQTEHNVGQVFPPELYATKYPDIYPIIKGKKFIPPTDTTQGWQPNFNAPDILDAAKDSVQRYFKKYPKMTYMAISVNDHGGFDQSPETLAAIKEYQKKYPNPQIAAAEFYSQTYWSFMNKLGEWMQINEPGKLLLGLAYTEVSMAPDFKLSPNIIVMTVVHISELKSDGILLPHLDGASTLSDWLKVSHHYGQHEWLEGMGFLIPRSYTHYYSQFVKAVKASGAQDMYQALECYPNWGLDGPKYYITNQLGWNPDLNVDTLWKQFTDDMFGPASAPMYDYFQTLENLWVYLDNEEGPERKMYRWSTVFKTDAKSMAMIQQARADLDKAASMAATPDQKARINLFSKTFHLSEMLFDLAASPTVKQSQLDAIQKYFADEIENDPMTLYSTMRQPKFMTGYVLRVMMQGRKVEP